MFYSLISDEWMIIQELIEKLVKNELSKEDYPCLNDPSPTYHGTPFAGPVNPNPSAQSMRSRRAPTWARPRGSEDGYSRFCFLIFFLPKCYSVIFTLCCNFLTCNSYVFLLAYSDSVLRHTSSDFKKMGRRIFVFIVGGATRSEV